MLTSVNRYIDINLNRLIRYASNILHIQNIQSSIIRPNYPKAFSNKDIINIPAKFTIIYKSSSLNWIDVEFAILWLQGRTLYLTTNFSWY